MSHKESATLRRCMQRSTYLYVPLSRCKRFLHKVVRVLRRGRRHKEVQPAGIASVQFNNSKEVQPFDFLSLPAELRLLIYDFYYATSEVTCDKAGLHDLITIGHINRQIRNEAVTHIYESKNFIIDAPKLDAFVRRMPLIVETHITSMRLEEFPNFAMHYLFGHPPSTTHKVPLKNGQSLTDAFPNLRNLSIRVSKLIDKPPQPTQAILDRFLTEVTSQHLMEQESVQWLLQCRGLCSFHVLRKRPTEQQLQTLRERRHFGFLQGLVKAFDGLEEEVKTAVCRSTEEAGVLESHSKRRGSI